MKKEMDLNDLFEDQGDDPLWKEAMWRAREQEAGLPDGLDRGWVGFSLAWLEWVSSRIEIPAKVKIILLLHRKRLVTGSKTVSLSNVELERFGVSRFAKYRASVQLERYPPLAAVLRSGDDPSSVSTGASTVICTSARDGRCDERS